jgi:hypothetical protein
LLHVGDVAGVEATLASESFHRKQEVTARRDEAGVEWGRKELQKINSEIKRLTLIRGGRKGLYVYD